jgi:hypothetical protein
MRVEMLKGAEKEDEDRKRGGRGRGRGSERGSECLFLYGYETGWIDGSCVE